MKRAEEVKQKARELIERGRRPSAESIAAELNYSEPDIHRCLNFLENNGEVETYTKKILGVRRRMVGVERQ